MSLLDLCEQEPDPPPSAEKVRRFPRYPTFCVEPHLARRMERALAERDWRALRSLRVVWYDQYAERWFQVGPRFWDHMEYWEVVYD